MLYTQPIRPDTTMSQMRAMQLQSLCQLSDCETPLTAVDLPLPNPGAGEVLLQVHACGVCHTELDEIEGRAAPPHLPVVPGHQVVGTVTALGPDCSRLAPGQRVGVAWIYAACGVCPQCLAGHENLCGEFVATGRDVDGGYAQFMTVSEQFAYPLPAALSDEQAAPLLCGGAIGYRALRLTGVENGQTLGLTGFGASAHLVLQMARHRLPDSPVYVFARDPHTRRFALELDADWAGGTGDTPPEPLDAIIDTTPAWTPVLAALEAMAPGGRLVINAIRKEAQDQPVLQELDYPRHLWQEKEIKSVANISRRDVSEFLQLAAEAGISPETECYALADANRALVELKRGGGRGAKVLLVEH